MKLTHSKSVKFYPVFAGNADLPDADKFFVELRPMDRADLFRAAPEIVHIKGRINSADAGDYAAYQALQFAKETLEIFDRNDLKKYIMGISNLTLNGEPVSSSNLTEDPIFSSLVIEILMKLMEISSITEEDAKN